MVSDQLLLVLKLCLLALLYLFFFRVVRAVWAELRPLPQIPAGAATPPVAAPTRKRRKESSDAGRTRQLVVREPVELSGKAWALAGEVSIGRTHHRFMHASSIATINGRLKISVPQMARG